MLRVEISRTDKEQHIVDGIREGRKKTINHIYETYYPHIRTHVLKNSGTEDDAKDVFQDALMAVFQNVSNEEFELTCKFKTYLSAVSQNIWNKRLRSRKDKVFVPTDDLCVPQDEINDAIQKYERYTFFREMFEKLKDDCKTILQHYFSGHSMKEISAKLNHASVSYTKKRKFICKERLFKLIESDQARYKALVNYE
jgi:RNA polymerase sigma factor (sigma-70 family)